MVHKHWHSWGLRPRLAAVAEGVPEGARVVDVGTDHGKLPVALVRSGRASHAIAGDLREAPLKQARLHVQRTDTEAQVELRLGDGLSILQPHEADVALMAGLSGETIAFLLTQPASLEALGLKLLILQPNDRDCAVREALEHIGWTLTSESFVYDGNRLFLTMSAHPSSANDAPFEASWFPWLAPGDPLLPAWLQVKREWLSSIHQPDVPHPLYGEGYVPRWQEGLQQLEEAHRQREAEGTQR